MLQNITRSNNSNNTIQFSSRKRAAEVGSNIFNDKSINNFLNQGIKESSY